ncbi:metal-dependent transcriptional regulator [Glutamicibacter endophyticus]
MGAWPTKMDTVSISELSDSAQNYLKIIYGLQEWSSDPVTPSSIAQRAGMKLSTVSGALAKLRQQDLLDHSPYGEVALTERGRDFAVQMVRRHRLIETFLVKMLGYRWDQVHEEADSLEHSVSDFMIERMDQTLGYPTRDPHGDPIPAADGTISFPEAYLLADAAVGSTVVIERISDADSELLQHLQENGVVIGAEVEISGMDKFAETVEVRAQCGNTVALGVAAAQAIWVSNP